ncbi:MAG: adenosylcobinamide-GDP ribazoletransferase [Tannerellaceae bacterium]|nr:adenosylcobinamide-GDP ribazoletransferase [Tannerellaceae bacterium]
MTRILAAFIFFTRLPFWRLGEVPAHYFKKVVVFWPLTGWITAGMAVLILYGALLVLPFPVALVLAWITRLLVTGCLHEDGLADLFDGFGGGNNRERILAIMKDSHTGSYALVGLLAYGALLYLSLSSLPPMVAAAVILAGDPLSKAIAAQTINVLPYAREEGEAKNKTVYSRMTVGEILLCLACGLFPLAWLPAPDYLWAVLFPAGMFLWMTAFLRKRLGGYTGDCCGAIFLLCEVSFYLGATIVYHLL